ncbi:repressed by EFG1 protein 1 [Nilaparvata lugens]|uniref:repressed by EFG1 protein 1 n=1 Tax=Nilaparvata lugens TaxID=108931 RepID=UPI00193CE5FF|nr:repressed by EFG1 protein 1 [Nilaparvata lugens]
MEAVGGSGCGGRRVEVYPGGGIGPNTGAHWPPSRRREEAAALLNLQRRLQQGPPPPKVPGKGRSSGAASSSKLHPLDNRPRFLQKMLSNRPGLAGEHEDTGTDWLDSEFIAECLCWHNVYRQRHGVPFLSLCPQLCEKAQSWANHLAHTNTFFYRQDKDVGQNLFCRLTNTLQTDVTGQEVASYWYSAVRQYNYLKEPDVLHANVNAGHFTQLVWANTRSFGAGKARSRSGKILVVANYSPPGNTSGLFQQNVLPPLLELELELALAAESSMSGSDSSASRSAADYLT